MGGGGQSQGLLFGRGGSLPYPRDIVVPHNDYDCFFLLSFFFVFFRSLQYQQDIVVSHNDYDCFLCVFSPLDFLSLFGSLPYPRDIVLPHNDSCLLFCCLMFFVCVFIHNDSQQLFIMLFCCGICFCLNSCPYPHPWDNVIPFSTARKEKTTNNAERQSAIINDYHRPPLIGNN